MRRAAVSFPEHLDERLPSGSVGRGVRGVEEIGRIVAGAQQLAPAGRLLREFHHRGVSQGEVQVERECIRVETGQRRRLEDKKGPARGRFRLAEGNPRLHLRVRGRFNVKGNLLPAPRRVGDGHIRAIHIDRPGCLPVLPYQPFGAKALGSVVPQPHQRGDGPAAPGRGHRAGEAEPGGAPGRPPTFSHPKGLVSRLRDARRKGRLAFLRAGLDGQRHAVSVNSLLDQANRAGNASLGDPGVF